MTSTSSISNCPSKLRDVASKNLQNVQIGYNSPQDIASNRVRKEHVIPLDGYIINYAICYVYMYNWHQYRK